MPKIDQSDGGDHQRIGHRAEDRDLRDIGREPQQHRQEGDERHHRIDEADAQVLDGTGEAHGVFLDALRGALDVAQPVPVVGVVIVHRRAPAEDVVADEEAG